MWRPIFVRPGPSDGAAKSRQVSTCGYCWLFGLVSPPDVVGAVPAAVFAEIRLFPNELVVPDMPLAFSVISLFEIRMEAPATAVMPVPLCEMMLLSTLLVPPGSDCTPEAVLPEKTEREITALVLGPTPMPLLLNSDFTLSTTRFVAPSSKIRRAASQPAQ